MIMVETRYEIYDDRLVAIIEISKNRMNYLKNCKHKVLLFTNQNNLCKFMDTKSLSFCQIS